MKGSGKDYCLELLKKEDSNGTPTELISFSFSDQLKKICHELFPWLEADYAPSQKEKPIHLSPDGVWYSPRDIWTAMNIMVEIDPMILVRRVESEYRSSMSSGYLDNADFAIVKDLRPHNPEELAFCLRNDFKIIYIENGKDPIKDVSNLHTTERGYDNIKSFATATFINRKNNDTDFIEFLKGQVELWRSQQ